MSIMSKKAIKTLLIILTFLCPIIALADEGVEVSGGCNGIFTPEALDLIKEILRYLAILGPSVLVIMIALDLIRGVASGEKDEVGKSTGRIIKRVIATICLLIAPLIATILLNLPGVDDYLKDAGIVDDPLCGAAVGTSNFVISTKLSTTKYTKNSIKVTVKVEKGEAKYAVGSDGKRYEISDKSFTFTADKNGNYEFKFYNEKNELVMTKKITIKNIVNENPLAKCMIREKTIYVSATSLAGIYGYSYSTGGEYGSYTRENKYTSDTYITKASVNIQDNAGNITNIECENGGTVEQIQPTGKVIWSAESESLKVNVEDKDQYIAARVWAANPYQQLKVHTSTDYNEKYDKIANIMDKAITNNNLQEKIVIATNNLISNAYNSYICDSKHFPKYSCMHLIMKNGQVMYEDASNGYKSQIMFGLTLAGDLKPYPFWHGTSQKKIAARQKLIDEAKSDGIKDTHQAMNVLMVNGEIKGREYAPIFRDNMEQDSTDIRTGLCQVDKNNFIIFISKHHTITIEGLSKIMKSYNCKNGYNMDGGGSTTFKVKNQTETSLHRVDKIGTNGDRGRMWGILYFTEL